MNQTTLKRLQSICCTCLSIDRKLSRLSNLEDAVNNLFCLLSCDSEAYEELCEREAINLFICWECQALMYRICLFRNQACLAQKQLRDIINTKRKLPADKCLSKLSNHHQSTYNYEFISTDQVDDDEIDKDSNSIKSETETQFLPYPESCSDNEKDKEMTVKTEDNNELTVTEGCQLDFVAEKDYKAIKMTKKELLVSIEERKSAKRFVEAEFKCEDCIEIFCDNEERETHMKQAHEEQKNYKQCDICHAFVRYKLFNEHRHDHFLWFKCNYCDFDCHHILIIIKHLRKGHLISYTRKSLMKVRKIIYAKSPGLKPWLADVTPKGNSAGYQCSICREFFQSKKLRWQHVNKDHKHLEYRCSICSKTFTSANGLTHHDRIHKGAVPRRACARCGELVRSDGLSAHRRRHRAPRAAACAACDKAFASPEAYALHMRYSRRHAQEGAYKLKCPYCEKGFRTRNDYQDHIDYKHLGKMLHKCNICDKILSTHKLLRRHVLFTHDLVKKQHMRKKYLCPTCGTVCRDHTAYKEHLALHTGEKAYACDACPKRFRTGSALYVHRKKTHNLLPLRQNIKQLNTKNHEE